MLSNLHLDSLVESWTTKNESLTISPLLVACIISDDILAVCGLKTIGPDLQIDFAATWLSFPGRVWHHLFFLLLRFFLCFFFLDFFLHFVQLTKTCASTYARWLDLILIHHQCKIIPCFFYCSYTYAIIICVDNLCCPPIVNFSPNLIPVPNIYLSLLLKI